MPNTEMIEERLRFLEIDQDVTEELRRARRILEPELDRMLEEFYSHLLADPLIRRVFVDDESVKRARAAQKNHWLHTLFAGKFNSDYFDKTERIGLAHARVGLTPNLYIGGYSKMLVKFVQHISVAAAKEGRDPSPTITAVCKAILLDLDLVIQCYLEAKNESMLEILGRATTFSDDMENLTSEMGSALAEVRASIAAVSEDTAENERQASQMATLVVQVDALTDKVKQVEERTGRLKTDDGLYVHRRSDQTGTFARLKALIIGD